MATLPASHGPFAVPRRRKPAGPKPVTRELRLLPMTAMVSFYVFAYVLFLIWPINWPIYKSEEWLALSAYVALCLAALAFAFVFATRGEEPMRDRFRYGGLAIIAGTILAVVLLPPSSKIYTDRYPWEILDALRNQGETYYQFRRALEYTRRASGRSSPSYARSPRRSPSPSCRSAY